MLVTRDNTLGNAPAAGSGTPPNFPAASIPSFRQSEYFCFPSPPPHTHDAGPSTSGGGGPGVIEKKGIALRGVPLYLDMQATTPLDPRVIDAMLPYMTEQVGSGRGRGKGREKRRGSQGACR